MIKTDVLVIGAGVAGLSTAYHLAQNGGKSIIVIEQEKKLGGHASGRNAGMIRQAVDDPVLARLARDGRQSLSRLKWKGLGFRSIGSLLLAKGKEVSELKRTADCIRRTGFGSRWLSHEETERRLPVLRGGDFSRALFCPSDAVVEIGPLLRGFLEQLKKRNVKVYQDCFLQSIKNLPHGFVVDAGGKKFFAQKIVNAAGAWAGFVAEEAGASQVPFSAYRRHLFESGYFSPAKNNWPFVWDLSHQFYFRPIKKGFLLLSPCDKTLCALKKSGPTAGEQVDKQMEKTLLRKIRGFSKNFGSLKTAKARSGLRTMTPDGRFVVGEDPKLENFYWVAGLGGHGVTTCFAVGKLASDIISGRSVDPKLKKALSPGRF